MVPLSQEEQFSDNLRRLLGIHDLSGRQLARLLGTTPQSVSYWTAGKRLPSTQMLVPLASLFQIDPTRLISFSFDVLLSDVADPERFAAAEKALRRQNLKAVG